MTAFLTTEFATAIGYAGVGLYILAYALLQFGVLRGNGYAYTLLNLTAAGLVLFSLSEQFNAAAALLQGIWILLSLYGLGRLILRDRLVRFSAEDRLLVDHAFAGLPRATARRVLDAGLWTDLIPGTDLTREGAPVERLAFLTGGEVEVLSAGTRIGTINTGFIGEANVLRAGPASATTRTAAPSRAFVIPGDRLRRLLKSDPDLRQALSSAFSATTGRHLAHANARLSGALGRKPDP